MSVVLLPPVPPITALRNNANASLIDCGSATMLDSLATLTLIAWLKPSALLDGRGLFNKRSGANGGWNLSTTGTAGNVVFFNDRATANLSYTTSSAPLAPVDAWKLLAFTMDRAAGAGLIVRVYRADPRTPFTECTYSAQTDGSGAFFDDNAVSLLLAADQNGFNLVGDIGPAVFVNRTLSLAELRSWWRNPLIQPAGTVGSWLPGAEGAGRVLDRSGNANHGTITSMIPVAGPPFGLSSRTRSLALAGRPAATTGPQFRIGMVG